jgi:hypothetical protein
LTGLPPIVIAALFVALVLIAARHGDERLVFSVAVLGGALATPAFYFQALGLAAAAAAPWVASQRSAPLWRRLRPRDDDALVQVT